VELANSEFADGGYTWSHEYRMLCEARAVLRMLFDERKPYLEKAEKHRGKPAIDALKTIIASEYNRIKEERRKRQ